MNALCDLTWRDEATRVLRKRMGMQNPNRALSFNRKVSAGGDRGDVLSPVVSVWVWLPSEEDRLAGRQYELRFETEAALGRFLFKYAADPMRVFVEDFGWGGPDPARPSPEMPRGPLWSGRRV